jgi:hypothetical protein
MEHRVVICFITLKGLNSKDIHAECEPIDGPEALPLLTMKKWRRYFHQGRMDLFDDPRSGSSLTNDLAGLFGSVYEERLFRSCKVLCRHFQIGKATCL